MGKIAGLCSFATRAVKWGVHKLDPSWHELWTKSDFLKDVLGKADAFNTYRVGTGGSDAPAHTIMRKIRAATNFFRELEKEAGRSTDNIRSDFNSAIKADIGKLVRDRKNMEESINKLGFDPRHADLNDDYNKKQQDLITKILNLDEATDLTDSTVTEAFPETRKLLSKREANADGTVNIIASGETEAHFDSVVSGFAETEKMFRMPEFGMDFDKILSVFLRERESLYQGSFFEAMHDKSYASLRHLLVSSAPINGLDSSSSAMTKIQQLISAKLKDAGVVITENSLKKFTRDCMGDTLVNNFVGKVLMQMRPINTSLKYFIGGASGAQLLANSLVFNAGNLVTRIVGNRHIYDHDIIDLLLEKHGFLGSQGRIATSEGLDPDVLGTGFNKFIDIITDNIPSDKVKGGVKDIIKTGWHSTADWPFDYAAKKAGIMEALLKSPYGQSPKDLEEFFQLVKNLDSQKPAARQLILDELNKIRGDAILGYDQFFTNSGMSGVSRNWFSDWLPFSALQGYMVKRAADVTRPIHVALQKALDGDFKSILKDPELIRLIAATAYIGKIGAMAGRSLDKDDPEEAAKHYALALNDYYQGINGAFFMRLLTSPVRGWNNSVTLSDVKGEEHTFYNGISGAAYKTLSDAMAAGFRELKPLTALSTLVAGYRDTGDFGFALNASQDELDKILTGMSRFNLQEGFEPSGVWKIKQPDDWLSYVTMTAGESNKSLKASIEMRDLESMQKWLYDPNFSVLSFLRNAPVISPFLSEPSYSATKYGQYAIANAKDPQLQAMITQGVIPQGFFTPERTGTFWQELTKFDLAKYGISSDGKSVPFKEGTHDSEKMKLFLDQLDKKIRKEGMADGSKSLEQFLSQFKPNIKAEQLARMMVFSEKEVPGSARVLLSYVANKMYYAQKEVSLGVSGQNKYGTLINEDDTAIKSSILSNLYPLLYVADKTSFVKVPVAYLSEKYPAYFQKDGKDQEDIRTFTNSMALLDMTFAHEWQSGNPSSNWIKSVMATSAKWVADPTARLELMKHAFASVDTIPGTREDKASMKLGILAGSVDNLTNIAKDKVFMSNPENEAILKEALDVFWKGHMDLQDTPRKDAIDAALNADLQKAYGITSTTSSYKPKTAYSKSKGSANNAAYDKYMNAVPKMTAANPSWYQMPTSGGYKAKYNPTQAWDARPAFAKDPKWDAFTKQLGEARSQSLVSGYVEHFAGDKENKPYAVTRFAPKWKTVYAKKIPLEKVRWHGAVRF